MLNDTFIRSLKPAEKPKKYADGGGLFLYVPTTGSKLWRMSYRFKHKNKLLSFGAYPAVSLKSARDRRDVAKKLLAEGIDPAAHKKELVAKRIAEEANSFRHLAMEWFETQLTDVSEKYRASTLFRLNRYLFPTLGNMPINKIEAQDIIPVIRAVDLKNLNDTARRLVAICNHIFRLAVTTGRAKHNIAADLHGLVRRKQSTHRATIIDRKKIGCLLNNIYNYDGYLPVNCALQLLPFLFVRSAELCRAEWSEFDLEGKEWRIPASRMKMKQPHIVPLARQSVDILIKLREATGNGIFVFPSFSGLRNSIHTNSLLTVLRRMGYKKEELCVHGFRSMASTLLNEMGYNRDWIERQLAHVEYNSVRAAYNYADYLPDRRKMMQEWADFLEGLREKARQEQEAI